MSNGQKVLIVEGRFYADIVDEMVRGAVQVLDDAGIEYTRLEVTGAFEIPGAISMALKSGAGSYGGYIALGCVIRGETTHYDYVCSQSAQGLMDLTTHYGIAVGYGILTCENSDQAWVRAAVDQKNKGGDVAGACLRMMEIKRNFAIEAEG